MSKSVLDSITELFQPQLPLWACEFTQRDFVVAGVDHARRRIVNRTVTPLASGAIKSTLSERNFDDPDGMLEFVRNCLDQAGLKGSEIAVVIPDDSARISFLTADNLPSGLKERDAFIRWKLKKSMPFDVDDAQVDFKVLGVHDGAATDVRGTDLLVTLSPRLIIEEYVELFERANLHAGYVIPSTLAALNLLQAPEEDVLFVKIVPGCITTTVFMKGRLKFYRRVPDSPIYDAVYPTILYYQDKLLGSGIQRAVLCSANGDARLSMAELQEKLKVPVHSLEPTNVDDAFKPALGAVDYVWANSI